MLLTSLTTCMGWGGVGWGGLLTSKHVVTFSNHLDGVGWGGLLTFCLQRNSKYVANFSNHLQGLGWAISVLSTKNFQVRY